ncbi:hypothetical protein [Argonema galeatum]|uniref:hypothetical protein n=1 Tax=Argonema galeatum TaxID=2942762 RepID=UPI0020125985|nr:hypothetical protein [Argonema galeatum]MCL1464754.1 hypothetical protein [Argonema galeatum A003/A1]
MKETDDPITKQAFLVALVELPSSESAPLVDQTFITDPVSTVSRLRKLGQHEKFWQLYDDAYDFFMEGYHANPKDKLFPSGILSEASNVANNELENSSLHASVVEESFDRFNNIFQENPRKKAEASYKQFQKNPPEGLVITEYPVHNWAEFACRTC